MSFISQRNKFNFIDTQEKKNINNISNQQSINTRIDTEYNATISTISVFKKSRNLNTEWKSLVSVSSVDDSSFVIDRYFNETVEIQKIPEIWISYIKVNIEYRYINTSEERFFADQTSNIYFSVEDIVGNDTLKNLKICAGFLFFQTFLPVTSVVNKEIEARLNIKLQSPHNFI